jgi:orotate phosphoribosyltransferase
MAPQLAVSNEHEAMFEHQKDRRRAFELIKAKSFGRRDIVLASGKPSTFYFDMKPTMLNPEGATVLSELILARLSSENLDFVGGLVMGAVPLISTINQLSYLKGQPLPGLFVRQEVKTHGTMKLIEGVMDGELQGKRVAILDDVTTSGCSAMIAVEAVQKAGAEVVMVLSVVDRGEGATDFYRSKGMRFETLFNASEFLDS